MAIVFAYVCSWNENQLVQSLDQKYGKREWTKFKPIRLKMIISAIVKQERTRCARCVRLSVCLPACLPVRLPVFYLLVYLSVCLPACLPICLLSCLFICLFCALLSVCVRLTVYFPVSCLSVHLFICLCVYLFV